MSIIRPREIASLLIGLVLIGVMVTSGGGTASAAENDGAFSRTKTVTRVFAAADGTQRTVDSRDFTLNVDHTQNLRGRERVQVTWSGARPSAGRAANPYGENGLNQEYPVMVMQCRGLDDPSLPKAQQIDPTTCFTSTRQQRSQSASDLFAVWRHDLYATDADKQQKSGADPIPEECKDNPDFSTHLTPFVAASGKVYPACTAETMPPEASVAASFPPAEVSAFTDLDGKGSVNFEVRSNIENESLGCSDTTPCSLVVIPIMGISCADQDAFCEQEGHFEPGSSNFANDGVDPAVSPVYWWSESNWRNRVAVPLTFGLPPNVCNIIDTRAPTAFYGSELMNQASLQWAPAYCLNKKRFKFQHNAMGDDPAFVLVENGAAPAAFVSGTRERSNDDPVGYAPTAVTGFAVSFIIDNPKNTGERTNLNLTPRLLAKLLSQSYTGSSRGQQHPGMENNPLSINLDPEFQALNPDLDTISREAAATVMSISNSSDVIKTLTAYIANDPEAKAFMAGKADPWGMVVNPSYKGLKLPVSEFPLLDTFVPTSNLECQQQNPAPYFSQIAAPVTSLTKVAEAVLDGWPYVQTKCERSSSSDPFKVGRVDRQGIGSRFLLGIVSLGDAARYGLRTAALQTSSVASPTEKLTGTGGRTFVTPTTESLLAAVKTAKATSTKKALTLDVTKLTNVPSAYPGTMIVYTVAKTRGLAKADAKSVASFIRIATTEGQVRGSGNGQLPDGFVPITKSGATAVLYKQAQEVAKLVEAQTPAKEAKPAAAKPAAAAPAPAVAAPAVEAPAAAPATTPTVVTEDVVATASQSSGAAGALLPLLIGLALLAGLGGPAMRIAARIKAAR